MPINTRLLQCNTKIMSIEKIKKLAKLVDELEKLDNRMTKLLNDFNKAEADRKRIEAELKDNIQAFDWHDEGKEYIQLSSGTYCLSHNRRDIYKIDIQTLE